MTLSRFTLFIFVSAWVAIFPARSLASEEFARIDFMTAQGKKTKTAQLTDVSCELGKRGRLIKAEIDLDGDTGILELELPSLPDKLTQGEKWQLRFVPQSKSSVRLTDAHDFEWTLVQRTSPDALQPHCTAEAYLETSLKVKLKCHSLRVADGSFPSYTHFEIDEKPLTCP